MTVTAEEQERVARSAYVRLLMEGGYSRADANLIIDMSKHAVHEAQAAILRVLDTVPPELRIPTVALAMAGLRVVMERGEQQLLKSAGVI